MLSFLRQTSPVRLAVILLFALTCYRLWFITQMQLVPDEAYYWLWSKHLAASYRDKGPGIAWTIALGTKLFGPTVFGIRFFAVILSTATGALIFALARRLYDDRTALWCLLMASVMPGMALGTSLHPDWGTYAENYGIPITAGPAGAPVPLTWTAKWGPTESDPLPCPSGGGNFCYPIPLAAKIEGGAGAKSTSDRHLLFLATDAAPDHCVLYELYNTQNQSGPGFTAANGAIWHLDTNALRPEGWTSADAAGLPIMPGLVRVAEVRSGAITHAIRMTMNKSRQAYIHPATHAAGTAAASLPPMGLRLRLKAGFDASSLPAPAKVVASALQRYGVMLADNGSDWYIGGESSDDWADLMSDLVSGLSTIKGSDFEIVKTGDVVIAAP